MYKTQGYTNTMYVYHIGYWWAESTKSHHLPAETLLIIDNIKDFWGGVLKQKAVPCQAGKLLGIKHISELIRGIWSKLDSS